MLKTFEKSVGKTGFTLVELLTVMAIIALLIGLLVPALGHVKTTAKIVQQKAQLKSIETALEAFSGMYGDYPPSNESSKDATPLTIYGGSATDNTVTCGAQKLAEAVLGVDLKGYDPRASAFIGVGGTTVTTNFDRLAIAGDRYAYAVAGVNLATAGPAPIADDVADSVNRRKGPYVKIDESVGSFEVKNLFTNTGKIYAGGNPGRTALNVPAKEFGNVITDVFKVKNVTYTSFNFSTSAVEEVSAKVGTPILYFKANASSKVLDPATDLTIENSIYNWHDNMHLVGLNRMTDPTQTKLHYWMDPANPARPTAGSILDAAAFYSYIQNPKISTSRWPYNQDTYILISAGPDGIYGNADDICNFTGGDAK